MVGRPVGGLNVSRNFSLNPYRLPYPTGSQNFVLQARSLVKYFVNGTMIKSEYLPAGNYTAKDIPLNNGLNTIVIEATDDLGQKKVFIFRSAASINLLNEGENRFDISYGTPIFDQNFKREYRHQDGNLLSSFFQYGFSSSFSTSVYGQNQKNFTLLGSEMVKATVIGNIGAGVAHSEIDALKGEAEALSYQFVGSGTKWYFSHSLGLRYEHKGEDFRTSTFDTTSTVQNTYSGNYALPIAGYLTTTHPPKNIVSRPTPPFVVVVTSGPLWAHGGVFHPPTTNATAMVLTPP
jgi:outer membrane usher protein